MNDISIYRKLVYFFSDLLIKAFGLHHPNKFLAIFLERIKPLAILRTSSGNIQFNCTNELLWWRIDTFKEKEPETVQWIQQMQKGEIFCDIGANIGLYSLFAARCGLEVLSFEPEALNFAELCRNTVLNNFRNLSPFNIALSNKTGLISFKMSNPYAGAALHVVEQMDNYSKKGLEQTVQGETLDNMIQNYRLPCPNHIKIDVDGLEYEIVQGMKQTLQNPALKTLLIEIDENKKNDSEIINIMTALNFKMDKKTNYPHKINNYIFRK